MYMNAKGVARCVEKAATGGWAGSGTGHNRPHGYGREVAANGLRSRSVVFMTEMQCTVLDLRAWVAGMGDESCSTAFGQLGLWQ